MKVKNFAEKKRKGSTGCSRERRNEFRREEEKIENRERADAEKERKKRRRNLILHQSM